MSTHAHFSPSGASVTLDATATSGIATLPDVGTQGGDIHFYNHGPNSVFFTFGKTTATAGLDTSMGLGVGHHIILSFPSSSDIDTVAGICESTETAKLVMTPGHGGI